ncbi:MAG: hypothetical protein H6706_24855 [Myxococcales bacterium]|nr:hypothetical protein [Myxococcales bacterium]
MIRLAASIVMAAVAGGGGCGTESQRASRAATDRCQATLPCPESLRCEEGACVGADPPDWPLTLRVRPAADLALAAVELSGLALTAPVTDLASPIRLPFRVGLDGQVLDPDGRSVPATRVVALPVGGLGDEPLAVEGDFSAVNPAIFSLDIAPWWPTSAGMRALTTYALRLSLPGLPPWEARLRWNQAEPRVVVEIPRTDAVSRLPGEVRVGGSNSIPLAGVQVTAVDPVTGEPLSSEGLSDALGRFEIRFWPMGEARTVRLVARGTDPTRPLPTVTAMATIPATGLADAVTLEVGDTGRLFPATVRVVEDGAPLVGARVRLEGQVGAGTVVLRGATDASGQLRLPVYPGRYLIDVTPSVEVPARITRVERDLAPEAAEVTVSPRPRTPVAGVLVDADGAPVVGALVEAHLARATFGDPALVRPDDRAPARIFRAETREDGSFLLALDPGTHRLLLTPGRGLPAVEAVISFSGEQPRTLDRMVLPPAAVLLARLVDEDDAPVAGALVEAWATVDPPVRLAVGESAADGRVRLVLPTRIAPDAAPAASGEDQEVQALADD